MKTTKPLSTISYNSFGFLTGKLKDLTANDILKFWAFIEHMPEEDEKKNHFHVFMLPAKQVDDVWLQKQFIEPDPQGARKCLLVEKSKFVDWYWYVLHDARYLASKGQSRKFHYLPEQVFSSEPDYLAELVRNSPLPKNDIDTVYGYLKQGLQPLEIARLMNIPLTRLNYAINAIVSLSRGAGVLDRNGRSNHEEQSDPDFGMDDFI